jgi:predicted Zn-dependent protease
MLRARVAVYEDADVADLLTRVTSALLADGERASRPEVVVLADPTIGAFVLPSGRIYLHTGLLARLDNEAQLAAILGRALTLTARRAALEARAGGAAIDETLLAMPTTVAAALASPDPTVTVLSPVPHAILGARLTVVYVAAMAGYGAALEAEADAGALRRLVRAGYDPKAAPKAFERLRREAKAGGPIERCYLAQEGALGERIESLARLVAGDYVVAAAAPGTIETTDDFEEAMAGLAGENARLELRIGRFRAAQEQIERAITIWPGDARAHLTLGDLYRLRGQRARGAADRDELARRAMVEYERAAVLDPDLAEVARQVGLLYYQQGQHARAREAFERYLAGAPDAADAARVREYLSVLRR